MWVWAVDEDRPPLKRDGLKGKVESVAWSSDGKRLAAGGNDGLIWVWDRETGRALSLQGHAGAVGSLAWSPDGTRLLSGGSDQTVRVWKVPAFPGT